MGEITYNLIVEPAGLSSMIAALAMHERGFKVAFHQQQPQAINWPESAYVALNLHSKQLLNSLDIYPKHGTTFNAIQVEMNHEPLSFSAADIFQQSLATVLPLKELAQACHEKIKDIPVSSADQPWKQQGNYLLKTKHSETTTDSILPHYVSTALIHTNDIPDNTATQFFRIHEVFGILPTDLKNRFALIHSAPQPLSTDRLQARLKLLGVNATHIEAHQPYFKIKMYHKDQYIQHRELGLHNACHMVHPMAGFGLNMGLSDISCLVKHFPDNLLEFRRACLEKNTSSVFAIEQLFSAYCKPQMGQDFLDVGVRIVNHQKLIKAFLMLQAQSV